MQGPELFILTRQLLQNPGSSFFASVAKWSRPMSYTEMRQFDLVDVLLMRWMPEGKFKPTARPSDVQAKKKPVMSRTDVHKRLRPHLYET